MTPLNIIIKVNIDEGSKNKALANFKALGSEINKALADSFSDIGKILNQSLQGVKTEDLNKALKLTKLRQEDVKTTILQTKKVGQEYSNTLKEMKIETEKAKDEAKKFREEQKKNAETTEETRKKTINYTSYLKTNFKSALKGSANAIKTIRSEYNSWSRALTFIKQQLRDFKRLMDSIISPGRNFESTMKDVEASLGGTAEEIERLTKFARDLAKDMPQTASQVASAINEMAKAGKSADEIMLSLRTNIQLAKDFGNTAKAAASVDFALTNFNLSAEKAVEVGDKLALSFADSKLNASIFTQAIQNLRGTTARFNTDINEGIAAMELWSDAGIKGRIQGRAFRVMLENTSEETTRMTEGLTKLGITYEKINPVTNTYTEIIKNLADAQAGEAENAAALRKIYGTFSGNVAILVNNYDEFVQKQKELDLSTGSLNKRFETLMDSLKGDELIKASAIEELRLKIYDQFNDELRESEQNQTKLINTISGSISVVEGAGDVFKSYIDIIEMLRKSFQKNIGVIENVGTGLGETAKIVVKLGDVTAGFTKTMIFSWNRIAGLWETSRISLKALVDDVIFGFKSIQSASRFDFVGAVENAEKFTETNKKAAKDIENVWLAADEILVDAFSGMSDAQVDTEETTKNLMLTTKQLYDQWDEENEIKLNAEKAAAKIGTLRSQWKTFISKFERSQLTPEMQIDFDFNEWKEKLTLIFGDIPQEEIEKLNEWRLKQNSELQDKLLAQEKKRLNALADENIRFGQQFLSDIEKNLSVQVKFYEESEQLNSTYWELRTEQIEIGLLKEVGLTDEQLTILREIRLNALDEEKNDRSNALKEWQEQNQEMVDIAKAAYSALSSGMSNLAGRIIDGANITKIRLKDVFQDILRSFSKMIADMIAKWLAAQAIMATANFFVPGSGNIIGKILGFQEGVVDLPGGIKGKDSIPAMLTPGESIIREKTTEKFKTELIMMEKQPEVIREIIERGKQSTSVLNPGILTDSVKALSNNFLIPGFQSGIIDIQQSEIALDFPPISPVVQPSINPNIRLGSQSAMNNNDIIMAIERAGINTIATQLTREDMIEAVAIGVSKTLKPVSSTGLYTAMQDAVYSETSSQAGF